MVQIFIDPIIAIFSFVDTFVLSIFEFESSYSINFRTTESTEWPNV